MEDALKHASDAADFCEQTFGNASNEALFWKAAALHGLSRNTEALEVLEDLSARRFQYPNLGRLLSTVRRAAGEEQRENGKDGRPAISLVL